MIAEIVATGNEVIRGRTRDANTFWIARELTRAGHDVRFHSVYPDDLKLLTDGLRLALRRARLVIVTGGLGPTVDDLTRRAAARATGRRLAFDDREWERLRALRPDVPGIVRRQAHFPAGSKILANPVGSASGFLIRCRGTVLAALSGVPREMRAMLPAVLEEVGPARDLPPERVFHIAGVPESDVESRILPKLRGVRYGISATGSVISLYLACRRPGRLRALLEREFGPALLGEGEVTLASETARLLLEKRATVSVAESVTGGRIAAMLTGIPGISASLREAVVAYSDGSKISRLGVSRDTLRRSGAVSEQVAREMAEGIRARSGSDLAVSTTGIAGPAGGTPDRPVGLVCFAVTDGRTTRSETRTFGGTRIDIQERAAEHALLLLRSLLLT